MSTWMILRVLASLMAKAILTAIKPLSPQHRLAVDQAGARPERAHGLYDQREAEAPSDATRERISRAVMVIERRCGVAGRAPPDWLPGLPPRNPDTSDRQP